MSAKGMSKSAWQSLRGVDKSRMREARLQAHYAAQWLARTARAYIPPQPNDGHTSLIWDRSLAEFRTQPLKNGARLSLQVAELTLAVNDKTANVESLQLNGHIEAAIRQWLGACFGKQGLDSQALDAPSPYEMPAHAIANGAAYNFTQSADALAELAAWYANAEFLLGKIQVLMTVQNRAASPVCCWPHHFDIATLATFASRKTNVTNYIGVGLSPGDDHYDEPYFYISLHPAPDALVLPSLPTLGHWHTREFTAAIAPAHKIVASNNQEQETDEFLRHAVALARKILD